MSGAPAWSQGLADQRGRKEFVRTVRTYYDVAILPHSDHIQAHIDADRSVRARALLDGGTDGLLAGLRPYMRWRYPVLEVDYTEDRDLYLRGRGLTLVPSYFCWGGPVSLADSGLPPVLAYPLRHEAPRTDTDTAGAQEPRAPLSALLGTTRAVILRAATPTRRPVNSPAPQVSPRQPPAATPPSCATRVCSSATARARPFCTP